MLAFLNRRLRILGIEVRRVNPNENLWLNELGISNIIDIGANEGQFALYIHQKIPNAKIHSFEPLSDSFKVLEQKTKRINIELYNFGVGDEDTQTRIYTSKHSPSSSLLKMNIVHKKLFPLSNEEEKMELINVRKLDSVFDNSIILNDLLVKIDVQGFEKNVLLGGENTIKNARVVIIETCYIPLYENQPTFEEIHNILVSYGFSFRGNEFQYFNPQNGSPIFGDAIYVKN